MRVAALAIGTITVFTLVFSGINGSTSQATSPPSAQRFSVDMEPALLPANTATSIGTTEPRARINENNVLDADEDFTDTVQFDVTVRGIPTENPMTAYGYMLSYPNFQTRITFQAPWKICGDGCVIVNGSDPVPDTDGSLHVSVADSSGPAESGDGVLDRLHIQSLVTATTGVYPLTLSAAFHTDTEGASHVPDAIDGGNICINTACGNPVDIEMVSMSLTSANPVPNDIPTAVTTDESIRNDSGYTVNVDARTTFTLPTDCILSGASGTVVLNAGLGLMAGLTTVAHQETPSLRCTEEGPHQMPVTGCGVLDDAAHIDPFSANNCITQTLSFDVTPPDTDGDGYTDEAEAGTPLCGDGLNEDGLIAGGASDDDVADDGCPGGPPQAGNYSEAQFNIGTDPLDSCGTDGNPADLVGGGMSENRVDLSDLTSFLAPTRYLDKSPGDAVFDQRWDLDPGHGAYLTWINLSDLVSIILVRPQASPWNGNRAFSGPACSP